MSDLPKINRKLFGQVYELITKHPEKHDQDDWDGSSRICGTTHCVGGWALVIHTGENSVAAAAESVLGGKALIRNAATEILGLTREERELLFYTSDNETAAELCRRYATGGRRSANVLINSTKEL